MRSLRRDQPVAFFKQQLVAKAFSGSGELNHDDNFIVSRESPIAEGAQKGRVANDRAPLDHKAIREAVRLRDRVRTLMA